LLRLPQNVAAPRCEKISDKGQLGNKRMEFARLEVELGFVVRVDEVERFPGNYVSIAFCIPTELLHRYPAVFDEH
jgi:hypothetical protein